jgi:hypothetical protein
MRFPLIDVKQVYLKHCFAMPTKELVISHHDSNSIEFVPIWQLVRAAYANNPPGYFKFARFSFSDDHTIVVDASSHNLCKSVVSSIVAQLAIVSVSELANTRFRVKKNTLCVSCLDPLSFVDEVSRVEMSCVVESELDDLPSLVSTDIENTIDKIPTLGMVLNDAET